MNKRVKELLVQAIREVGPDDADRGAKEKTLDKFSELLVKECVAVVNAKKALCGSGVPDNVLLDMTIKDIFTHLGVEK